MQGLADILDGTVRAGVETTPALIGPGAEVAPTTRQGETGSCSARAWTIGAGHVVNAPSSSTGATVGAGCVLRDCVVAAGARIGDGTRVEGFSMLGEGVRVGAGDVITHGARLFPGVDIPDGGMLF